MNYCELNFEIRSEEDFYKDLIIDALAGIGFGTFEETAAGFKAFIPEKDFDQTQLDEVLKPYGEMVDFVYSIALIPQKNWNEVWESNFEPLQIGDKCYIRATFHQPKPEMPYEVVIDPKMAFGTGHHQTTAMMIEYMLEENFKGTHVLDMGCGTGILAILASMLGANRVMAIDYDPVCYESTLENEALNKITNLEALCGSKEVIPAEKYDVVLANINRNILLDQMETYIRVLKEPGILLMSGFYEEPDLSIIKDAAKKLGLKYCNHKMKQNWVAVKFAL